MVEPEKQVLLRLTFVLLSVATKGGEALFCQNLGSLLGFAYLNLCKLKPVPVSARWNKSVKKSFCFCSKLALVLKDHLVSVGKNW